MSGVTPFTLADWTGGQALAVDNDGTNNYQLAKLTFSATGVTPTEVSAANPLPVNTVPTPVSPSDHPDVTVPTALAVPAGLTATDVTSGGTSLPASTTFYFQVTALNADGTTTPSSIASATTSSGLTDSIDLAWTAVTGATSYDVWYSTSSSMASPSFINTTTNSYTFVAESGTAGTIPAFNSTSTDTSVVANASRKSVTVYNLSSSSGSVRVRAHGSTVGGYELLPGSSYNLPTQAALDVYNPNSSSVSYGWQEYA